MYSLHQLTMKNDKFKMAFPILKHPWCCPEPRCLPLHQLKDSDYSDISQPEPGQSWLCHGAMKQPVTFTYDGVEHENDLNSCSYTPLKGVIRNQENKEDWENIVAAYTRALMRLTELRAGAEDHEEQ